MSSGVARAVEYPSGGRAATTSAHETIDAAPPPPYSNSWAGFAGARARSSPGRTLTASHSGASPRHGSHRNETWRMSARDRNRHFAIAAAMALAAATSCGGASASKREVPPGSPPALPTATVEAPTTSPAASAVGAYHASKYAVEARRGLASAAGWFERVRRAGVNHALVRPDGYVAWRSLELPKNPEGAIAAALTQVASIPS
jgi:hypothetical protein